MRIQRIEHVQLAMPAGRENEAVAFYEALLGIPQVPKPPHLAVRGGSWFERGDLKIHLGVEIDFRPERKAHPALLVDDLPALVERLRTAGVPLRDDEPLDGFGRTYADDPFGNRIELLEPTRAISFRALTVDDLNQLVEWFADPVIAAWWDQPAEIDSVTAKYLPRIDGTGDPTLMWIAEIDGEPAGLLQSYRCLDPRAALAALHDPCRLTVAGSLIDQVRSVDDLVARTELARSTVLQALGTLRQAGLVEQTGADPSGSSCSNGLRSSSISGAATTRPRSMISCAPSTSTSRPFAATSSTNSC